MRVEVSGLRLTITTHRGAGDHLAVLAVKGGKVELLGLAVDMDLVKTLAVTRVTQLGAQGRPEDGRLVKFSLTTSDVLSSRPAVIACDVPVLDVEDGLGTTRGVRVSANVADCINTVKALNLECLVDLDRLVFLDLDASVLEDLGVGRSTGTENDEIRLENLTILEPDSADALVVVL